MIRFFIWVFGWNQKHRSRSLTKSTSWEQHKKETGPKASPVVVVSFKIWIFNDALCSLVLVGLMCTHGLFNMEDKLLNYFDLFPHNVRLYITHQTGPVHTDPKSLEVHPCNLGRWEPGISWDWPLYVNFQGWHGCLHGNNFGGETWDLCWDYQTLSQQFILYKIIKIRL
jgi:hypothetical protein